MNGPSSPAVFNIPAGAPFADRLVAGIVRTLGIEGAPSDPLTLARATILVPTRRAVRSVTDAFARRFGGAVVLLPRILPLGEIEADDLGTGDLDMAEDAPDGPFAADEIPPAIPPLRRQMILASLVQTFGASAWRETPSADQAARLAAELARLLDQVETEELSFAGLETLVPDQFARHWQDTLAFFKILTLHWPEILKTEGLMDPSARRIRLLRARAAAWQRHPPQDPVIAAGSTGSIPATADLLATIARLPKGAIVLPGLDMSLSDESWAALQDSHPQFGLKKLLETVGVERAAVKPWPGAEIAPASDRIRLFGAALAPAAVADREGAELTQDRVRSAARGLTRIDCPTPDDEAGVIALLMREALVHETQTCALVTPDRNLARRVAAALGRWNIDVDDSAGTPLALTPAGLYFRLAAEAASERFAPLPLLAFLKHPLASGGLSPGEFRSRIRRIEMLALRGPRPDGGLDGIAKALRAHEREPDAAPLARWLESIAAAARSFAGALESSRRSVGDILRAHTAFIEALAATDSETGAERLWRGDDGEALARFIAEFEDAARGFAPVGGRDYPALLSALLAGQVVRPRAGRHPRLFIWGPLEARLQGADRLILGGLNEGTWPREAEADAWMSRPMRAAFKLPPPERRIGLAAHDFVQGACAADVFLTRSIRVEGTPTVPARWLVRLDHFLQRVGVPGSLGADKPWLAWQAALDRPESPPPATRPAPCPPVSARPRRLSVTDIETWMRDPYALYAKRILGLAPLDPIDQNPDAATRGSVIHDALDAFLKEFPETLPDDDAALKRLLELGRDAFGKAMATPGVWAFWWPRFERVARWFVAHERNRRLTCAPLTTEARGEITFDVPNGPFTLVARADRIDRRLDDGRLVISDYKTGEPPSATEVAEGFAPQLPLEAAMVERGAFDGVPPLEVAGLLYWRLAGGNPPGEVKPATKDDLATLIADAFAGVEALVATFDDKDTPYIAAPRDRRALRYSDYEHLARTQEWANADGEGAE
ncbi:MAG: double-strand break repair protein AddB [Gemmatimonas sp.]